MKEWNSEAKIHTLGDEIINQIKAGEVVERPLSVVKELVENALDAGAGEVSVDIFDGGKTLIRVTDTGSGMSATDARLSVVRHATSKIERVDDLEAVSTFGFRGEALASIAAVSRFELRTRARGATLGTVVSRQDSGSLAVPGAQPPLPIRSSDSESEPHAAGSCDVGSSWSVKSCAAPEGTQIEVKDLFYNTPARLKFLKSTPTEYAHIFDFLQAMAFAYPAVGLTFSHNRKRVFQYRADPDFSARAERILGPDRAGFMHVTYEKGSFGLNGLIGLPSQARSVPRVFLLFVNGRLVRDKVIRAGVMQAYSGLVLKGLIPSVVLFVRCDPGWVDVNAHPSKTEVRFRDPLVLQDLVCLGLQDALHRDTQARAYAQETAGESQTHAQPLRLQEASSVTRVPDGPRFQQRAQRAADCIDSAGGSVGFDPHMRTPRMGAVAAQNNPLGEVLDKAPPPTSQRIQSKDPRVLGGVTQVASPQPVQDQTSRGLPVASDASAASAEQVGSLVVRGGLAGARFLGQFARCYLIIELNRQLWVVDQHAFHERILFEEYRALDAGSPVARQGLLTPIFVPIPPAVGPLLAEAADVFDGLGFEIEWVAKMESLAVHAFPAFLRARIVARVMDEVICRILGALEPTFENDHPLLARAARIRQAWADEGRSFASVKSADMFHLFYATIACHSAVRAGEELHADQIAYLLGRAADVDFSAHCPHGRPVLRKFALQDVEAWFER